MSSFTRRELLLAGGVAAASGWMPAGLLAQSRPTSYEGPSPCPPGAWKKHGIVLEGGDGGKAGQIQDFTCHIEPLDGGRWRIWYSGGESRKQFSIGYAEGRPGEPFRKVRARYATGEPDDAPLSIGNLPEGWNPVQPVAMRLKNGRYRVYFWAHGEGILRYLAAESDDGRRYRVLDPLRPVLYHPNDRAAQGIPSLDGVVLVRKRAKDRPAGEPEADPRLMSNDATNVYQLPDGSFEMYSVGLTSVPKGDPAYMAHDNAPGLLRVIDRYTSEDGLRFTTRERVIQRDAGDPVDQQFYYLAVTYTKAGRVGMLGHYRVQAQTMDIEWCFSRDGKKWERPVRGAWLPRGDKSQPDSYGVYAPAHLLERDGKWHLFYTAVNSAHNGKESYGPSRSVVMYATTDSIWA